MHPRLCHSAAVIMQWLRSITFLRHAPIVQQRLLVSHLTGYFVMFSGGSELKSWQGLI